MLALLLTTLSSLIFPPQLTNNVNSITINPPLGSTQVTLTIDHSFDTLHLWETENSDTSYFSFYELEMRTRCGWRLQSLSGFTYASTRSNMFTTGSGSFIAFDGAFDGLGSSGHIVTAAIPTSRTIVIPLSVINGNTLLLKSEARTYANANMFIGSPTLVLGVDIFLYIQFTTYSNANVNITYQ